MGDLLPGSHPQDITAAGLAQDEHQGASFKSPGQPSPFHSQSGSVAQGQTRPDPRSPAHPTSPHYGTQDYGTTPLNMGSMVGALQDHVTFDPGQAPTQPHQQGQRPLSGASTSALVYQLQQNLQLPGHPPGSLPTHSSYGPGFGPGQYQQNFVPAHGAQPAGYPSFQPNPQRLPGPNPIQNPYQGFQQHSQYAYYPNPYGPQSQFTHGYPAQPAQAQPMYGRRPSLTNPQLPAMGQNVDASHHEGHYPPGGRLMQAPVQAEVGPVAAMMGGFSQTGVRSGSVSSIPRGPPRKPKQSGHALWVGNLPPGTTVVALKDHFSRDATKDIESLFLISKSNCAFVNYRTEASCTSAMHRFHDSRFNGVRLVCRLRRSSAPASGVPTGPSAMVGNKASPPRSPEKAEADDTQTDRVDGIEAPPDLISPSTHESRQSSTAAEKYFIVKSLTLQDLELSVRNGIWATQSHNEDALNKAYQSADHVYLVFSANKSGEYFGYARMASPILEDATHLIGTAPKPEVLDAPDVPKSIPTPATEFAPKGRIIDDSARGTIFWEAEHSESEPEEGKPDKEEPQAEGEGPGVAQSWGKPFKVEWISTNRLPFYRTRGLRNPWNANREVKIARDGTELETSVGERLVQMFHRLGPPNAAGPPMMQPHPQLGGLQMRPY